MDKTNHRSLLSNYLSTPSPLRGTHPCLRGRKWMLGYFRNTVVTISPRQQTVPLRQVGRGAKRRRGWIRKIAAHYYLDYLSTPSPLRGTHPCPRGRKWMLGYCRNTVVTISPRQQTVPLRQGANEVLREMAKCHLNPYSLITYPPPPHYVVLTPVSGGESGCSVIAGIL